MPAPTNTVYPQVCFTALSSISLSKNDTTTFHHILEFTINFINQDLILLEKNALNDCLEMVDQTLYELGQATDDLHEFPPSCGYCHRSYGNIKTLLSAAVTNENTCIDGFSNLELESESEGQTQNSLKKDLQHLLNPILRMLSNSLAMIKNMEIIIREETLRNTHMLTEKMPLNRLLAWMRIRDRKMMESASRLRSPNVIVAKDGSGNYTMISEAVNMAPNNSLIWYVIKIK